MDEEAGMDKETGTESASPLNPLSVIIPPMPRTARSAVGGMIYHVLNRARGRRRLFYTDKEYAAFLQVLLEAHRRFPGVRILALCLMPNHWHLVLLPGEDGELSLFMRWLTQTHTQRWRHAKDTVGQERFASHRDRRSSHRETVKTERKSYASLLFDSFMFDSSRAPWRLKRGSATSPFLLCRPCPPPYTRSQSYAKTIAGNAKSNQRRARLPAEVVDEHNQRNDWTGRGSP
jgi:REP element-mobilizing transposase RayT